jgi:hypothetical protein
MMQKYGYDLKEDALNNKKQKSNNMFIKEAFSKNKKKKIINNTVGAEDILNVFTDNN